MYLTAIGLFHPFQKYLNQESLGASQDMILKLPHLILMNNSLQNKFYMFPYLSVF